MKITRQNDLVMHLLGNEFDDFLRRSKPIRFLNLKHKILRELIFELIHDKGGEIPWGVVITPLALL